MNCVEVEVDAKRNVVGPARQDRLTSTPSWMDLRRCFGTLDSATRALSPSIDLRPSSLLTYLLYEPASAPSASAMSKPNFWSTPLRYFRWASHERPAYFWSILIGSMGPVTMVGIPPVRKYFGDVDPEPIPLSYPSKLPCRADRLCIPLPARVYGIVLILFPL